MTKSKSDGADKRPALKTQRQLAEAVRWLRFERRWSQEELAERSGVHRTYISQVERAKCSIGLKQIERIAKAFGLSVAELFVYAEGLGVRANDSPDPAERHCGEDGVIFAKRIAVYEQARHPRRWSRLSPNEVWLNRPAEENVLREVA